MGEALHGHRIAVANGRFHGRGKREETGHAVTSRGIESGHKISLADTS
jgi:hypothetical protein